MMQVSILVQVIREGLPAFFKGLPGLWVLKKIDDCIACHLLDIEVSHQNLVAKKPTDHLNNSNIIGVCVCVSLCHCVTCRTLGTLQACDAKKKNATLTQPEAHPTVRQVWHTSATLQVWCHYVGRFVSKYGSKATATNY